MKSMKIDENEGKMSELLKTLIRDGYILKRKDPSAPDTQFEYRLGRRAKEEYSRTFMQSMIKLVTSPIFCLAKSQFHRFGVTRRRIWYLR